MEWETHTHIHLQFNERYHFSFVVLPLLMFDAFSFYRSSLCIRAYNFLFYIIHFNSFPFLNDKMSFLHNEDKNKFLGYRISKALSKSKADILFTLEVKQKHTNVDERSKEISNEMKQKAVHCVYLIRIGARACLPLHFLCGILCALPYLSILATL